MFGSQDYKDYIAAVRQTGTTNPLVRVVLLPRSFATATRGDFLGYSIIPVAANGEIAADGATAVYLAMPHVFARTKEGCGQWSTPKAKAAGLVSKGFANSPSPATEADSILRRIVAVYGLPGSS